jgi:uncharacterized protein (DUF1810 family)
MEDLERFVNAQQQNYASALAEIKNGKKRSHWMWYVFPQVKGLGHSDTAKFYAINSMQEAEDYLAHPILGKRLIEICNALLNLESNDAHEIFGNPDDLKLKSSMTLFSYVPKAHPAFRQVLNKFFEGSMDDRTLAICGLL